MKIMNVLGAQCIRQSGRQPRTPALPLPRAPRSINADVANSCPPETANRWSRPQVANHDCRFFSHVAEKSRSAEGGATPDYLPNDRLAFAVLGQDGAENAVLSCSRGLGPCVSIHHLGTLIASPARFLVASERRAQRRSPRGSSIRTEARS
jgi:hypothetical protein